MSTGIPRPQTAPSLITTYYRPPDPEPSLTIGELAHKLLALLHLFAFHLFPALLFGILGLVFDDAARLFNTAAGFFRKENLPPGSTPTHYWHVKPALRPSTTPRRNLVDDPPMGAKPEMLAIDPKKGKPSETPFPCSLSRPASGPVTLSIGEPRKLSTESEGSKALSSVGAPIDSAHIKEKFSAPPIAKQEADSSFCTPFHPSPASSKVGPSLEPHVQQVHDLESSPGQTAGNEIMLSATAVASRDLLQYSSRDLLQYSSSQEMENIEKESSEDEASDKATQHEASEGLLAHKVPESTNNLPLVSSKIPGIRSGGGQMEDLISGSEVQTIDGPLANPHCISLRLTSAPKRAPPPPPYHFALEQSLHKRNGMTSVAPNPSPTNACSTPLYISATDAMDPSASDVATVDLDSQPASAGLSSVEQDPLQDEVDFEGTERQDSGGKLPLQDWATQRDSTSNVKNFVTENVDAYESFLMAAESELETARNHSTQEPSAPVRSELEMIDVDSEQEDSREVLISKLKSTLSSAADTDNNSLVKNIQEVNISGSPRAQGRTKDGEDAEERCFEDQEAGKALGRCSSKAVDVLEGALPHPGFTDAFTVPRDPFFIEEDCSNAEAPAGVDSLQELIPEVIPDVTDAKKPQFSDGEPLEAEVPKSPRIKDSTSDGTLGEAAIVSVTSMEGLEKLPSFTLPRIRSDTSFRTESYSSPNSPMHSSSTESTSQGRHRDSWRASDHDLFSEDPMMDMEGSSFSASRQLARETSGSNFDPAVLDDFDSTKMVSTPAIQSKRRASTNSSENEIDTSTPVTSSAGRDSAQSRVEELESEHSWQNCGKSSKCSEDTAERVAYRQASVDVTSRGSPSVSRDRRVLKDRARSKFSRRSPSHMKGRAAVVPRVGRPMAGSKMGRSVSTSETRFEDWPEYRPSRDELPAGLSRRHQSDMSFGSKSRKGVLLPEETSESNGPMVVGYKHTEDEIPHRFGGARRGWKFGFGRSPASKEGGDVKGVMKHILRRRRKISNLDECVSRNGVVGKMDSHHRSSVDKPSRRSVSMDAEFSFEIELPQDSAYALLGRICSDCGYRVVVSRPLYKMKVEIPLSGGTTWLLTSITLAKVWHGRGTHLSISRSKEDTSGGTDGEIESAGLLLRTRLEAHVEFLEDSFASLKLGSSVQEMKET